ncbi:scaffold protein gp20 membrane protease membrane protease membrane protease [Bacillus safensis FO-36b]|uniref:phage scaffolding protein n=1 Tax=Bacillus safensis TaxID=561879 RepID=UPI00045C384D|nr:phage scaffolding protein [Bacillus safensis]AWI35731.1 scaffolding protein [Bacillus safensis FO-36b]KDE26688.1 scaffold protein gp20 membrane protease membrane protease membrane protease [Bacillus safensis FO-36b]MCM3050259.1 phage scaffolding protein [Bacillus safensis]MEC1048589.1 phage scaffolding protein [Bacillus safensis]
MSLKELLGDDLYAQVIEKAGDQKIDIVSNGQWFPKERFDAVNNEKKELKSQLDERDQQLSTLQKQAKGNEELQNAIEQLQEENKKVSEEYQQKLDKQAFDFALESALRDAKARNIKSVKANLNVEDLKLAGDKVIGLEEQLAALKESDGYLFDTENDNPPGLAGRQPHGTSNSAANLPTAKNPFSKEHLNLTEQGQILSSDPEQAKKLIIQAGGNPAIYGL